MVRLPHKVSKILPQSLMELNWKIWIKLLFMSQMMDFILPLHLKVTCRSKNYIRLLKFVLGCKVEIWKDSNFKGDHLTCRYGDDGYQHGTYDDGLSHFTKCSYWNLDGMTEASSIKCTCDM